MKNEGQGKRRTVNHSKAARRNVAGEQKKRGANRGGITRGLGKEKKSGAPKIAATEKKP